MEDLKIEDSLRISAIIGPILNLVDVGLTADPRLIEKMNKIRSMMLKQTSMLESFPFPETLNKAYSERAMGALFDAIVDLFIARKKAIEELKKKPFAEGHEILKQLGLE